MYSKRLQNETELFSEEAIDKRYLLENEDEVYLVLEGPKGRQECTVRDFNCFGLSFVLPEQFVEIKHLGKFLKNIHIFHGKTLITTLSEAHLTSVSKYRRYKLLIDIEFSVAKSTDPYMNLWQYFDIVDDWQPSISFNHPFLYERQIRGKVLKLSKHGLLVAISTQNNDLLPHAVIPNLNLHIEGIGEIACSVEVESIEYLTHYYDQIFLYLKFVKIERIAFELFGQLLLVHGVSHHPSFKLIDIIKKAGLYPRDIKKHLSFTYLKSKEDYLEVLKLRLKAYMRAGKVEDDSSYLSMSDIYDDNSKIIVCKHHGRVIGSIRVTFCNESEDRFELEESITLPGKFADRSRCVEMSRLCVDDHYWGTDIVIGLIERAYIYSLKTGRKYLITSCVQSMWRFYKRMAFRNTKITFELKTLQGTPHKFIYIPLRSGMAGLGMHPAVFFMFFHKIVQFNLRAKSQMMHVGLFHRFWMFCNAQVGKGMLYLMNRFKKKKRR